MSFQLVTLRRLVMNDCRVGFFPATWRPSINRPADSHPSVQPKSGSPVKPAYFLKAACSCIVAGVFSSGGTWRIPKYSP